MINPRAYLTLTLEGPPTIRDGQTFWYQAVEDGDIEGAARELVKTVVGATLRQALAQDLERLAVRRKGGAT